MFAGSLSENLSYLHQDVTPTALDQAVDKLGARSLVERLGGYGAQVEPHSLSAGERQLITLVRAYVSVASASSSTRPLAIRPAAEARVERAFAERPGTLIVVAHRISSAQRARRILVLDGTRALLGTHEELLVQSELYRDLVGHWLSGAVSPKI